MCAVWVENDGPMREGMPGRHRLRDDRYVDAQAIGADEVRLDVAGHDPVTQRLYECHVSLTSAGVRLNPIGTRYAWPSERDLMARIAGLRLQAR